jgi:hypothetical protein
MLYCLFKDIRGAYALTYAAHMLLKRTYEAHMLLKRSSAAAHMLLKRSSAPAHAARLEMLYCLFKDIRGAYALKEAHMLLKRRICA